MTEPPTIRALAHHDVETLARRAYLRWLAAAIGRKIRAVVAGVMRHLPARGCRQPE